MNYTNLVLPALDKVKRLLPYAVRDPAHYGAFNHWSVRDSGVLYYLDEVIDTDEPKHMSRLLAVLPQLEKAAGNVLYEQDTWARKRVLLDELYKGVIL